MFFRCKQFFQLRFAVKHHGLPLCIAQNGKHLGVRGVAEHKERHVRRSMLRRDAVDLFDKRAGHVLDVQIRICFREGAEHLLLTARNAVRADDDAGRRAGLCDFLDIGNPDRADAGSGKMLVIRAVVDQMPERADGLPAPDRLLDEIGRAAHAEAETRLFGNDNSHLL